MFAEDSENSGPRPLLSTKLEPPAAVTGLIPRPDLVDRLTVAPGPMTLLTAPAGWGKSSLIQAWYETETRIETRSEADRSFAFLRLRGEDDDPTAFWTYVTGALNRAGSTRVPQIEETLRAPGIDPTRTLIPLLINALNDQDRPVVLVLDDYHTIRNPEVHRSLEYLIDNAPRCLNLAISTRTDPQLPLARYRAAGSLTEIRMDDLRLTPTETQSLLDQRFGVAIDDHDAGLLSRRTEGWPAGVQLAGVSMRADPMASPSKFIAGFAGDDRNVADYLASEVLRRQPERRRQFLLTTSILEEFNAELCDHLLQEGGSAAMLAEIEHHNLFLIGLDSRREWFRYHHLFRDWLRHTHRATADAADILELQRRAGRWLLENGSPERAIDQYLGAGELRSAVQIMDSVATRDPIQGHQPIRQWIEAVPDELAEHHPGFALARVDWLQTTGDASAAEPLLDIAERAIDTLEDGPDRTALAATATIHRGLTHLIRSDMHTAADLYEELLRTHPPSISAVGVTAQGLLGLAQFWTLGPAAAIPHLRQSAEDRRRLSMPDQATTPLLAAGYAELGRWADAEAAATETFAMPAAADHTYPFNLTAHYAMARVLDNRGRTAEATAHAEQGLQLARPWGDPNMIGWGCLILAGLVDDMDRRHQLVTEAKQLTSTQRSWLTDHVLAAEKQLNKPSRTRVLPNGTLLDPLTSRELDVLRMLRGDLSVREIGNQLFISYNTTKGYTKSIYQKLGVNSRSEAVATATQANLI